MKWYDEAVPEIVVFTASLGRMPVEWGLVSLPVF